MHSKMQPGTSVNLNPVSVVVVTQITNIILTGINRVLAVDIVMDEIAAFD